MATITHDVCGRSFRTQHGLDTHVICEPLPAPTPRRRRKSRKARNVEASKAQRNALIQAHTERIMRERGVRYVRANIEARKLVAAELASPAGVGAREQEPTTLPESGNSPARPHRTRGRRARVTSGRGDASLMTQQVAEDLGLTPTRAMCEALGLTYASA